MLSLFQKNQFSRSLAMLLYIFIVRIPSFLENGVQDTNGFFGALMIQNFDLRRWWFDLFAVFLLFFQASFLNKMIIENRILREISLFPGVFYILIHASIPGFYDLTPLMIANTFILFAVSNLLHIYKKQEYITKIFNTGFWLGIAFLFHFSMVGFILVGIVGIIILRSFTMLELARLLIGFFIPLFLVASILYWIDDLPALLGSLQSSNLGLMQLRFPLSVLTILVSIFFGGLVGVALLNYNQFIKKQNIQAIKKIDLFIWSLMIGMAIVIFIQFPLFQWWLFTAPFLAVFMAMLFQSFEKILIAEILHGLWFILTFAFYLIYINGG